MERKIGEQRNEWQMQIIKDYIEENHITKLEFCKQCRIGIGAFENLVSGKSDEYTATKFF